MLGKARTAEAGWAREFRSQQREGGGDILVLRLHGVVSDLGRQGLNFCTPKLFSAYSQTEFSVHTAGQTAACCCMMPFIIAPLNSEPHSELFA